METVKEGAETTETSLQSEENVSVELSSKILRSAVANYGGVFATVLAGFLLTPFIIRHWGDTLYGVWGLMGTIIGYFDLLDFGMSTSVAKYVAQYDAQEHPDQINVVVSTLFFYADAYLPRFYDRTSVQSDTVPLAILLRQEAPLCSAACDSEHALDEASTVGFLPGICTGRAFQERICFFSLIVSKGCI